MELKKIIAYGLVGCFAFSAGYLNKANVEEYWQRKNFPYMAAMKVMYERNAPNPILVNKDTGEKLEILVSEEGTRVGSIEYRLECLAKEAGNKKTAEQNKSILIEGADRVENAVYQTLYADKKTAKGFLQNYCGVRKQVSLNQNGEVEIHLSDGKETLMLTQDFQLGTQWDRIKGLYCENKEKISSVFNSVKTYLLGELFTN